MRGARCSGGVRFEGEAEEPEATGIPCSLAYLRQIRYFLASGASSETANRLTHEIVTPPRIVVQGGTALDMLNFSRPLVPSNQTIQLIPPKGGPQWVAVMKTHRSQGTGVTSIDTLTHRRHRGWLAASFR